MARWSAAWGRAGGVVYHYSAWRHRRLWRDHRAATAQFLGEWMPPESTLILLGSSAGYSLPNSLFSRFASVLASEPDPLARRLFHRNHPDVSVQWLEQDFLRPRNGAMTVAGLTELRALFPDAAVLFCNVLGQLPVLHDEADGDGFAAFLRALPDALQGASWASYHDRVSTPWPPLISEWSSPAEVGTQELMEQFYAPLVDGQPIEMWDHQTGALAPTLPRRLWLWQRTPSEFHVVEGVAHSAARKTSVEMARDA